MKLQRQSSLAILFSCMLTLCAGFVWMVNTPETWADHLPSVPGPFADILDENEYADYLAQVSGNSNSKKSKVKFKRVTVKEKGMFLPSETDVYGKFEESVGNVKITRKSTDSNKKLCFYVYAFSGKELVNMMLGESDIWDGGHYTSPGCKKASEKKKANKIEKGRWFYYYAPRKKDRVFVSPKEGFQAMNECGNGVKEEAQNIGKTLIPAEECDDGNKANGDGCSSACKREKATARR